MNDRERAKQLLSTPLAVLRMELDGIGKFIDIKAAIRSVDEAIGRNVMEGKANGLGGMIALTHLLKDLREEMAVRVLHSILVLFPHGEGMKENVPSYDEMVDAIVGATILRELEA